MDYTYYINRKGYLMAVLKGTERFKITKADSHNVYSDDLQYIVLI